MCGLKSIWPARAATFPFSLSRLHIRSDRTKEKTATWKGPSGANKSKRTKDKPTFPADPYSYLRKGVEEAPKFLRSPFQRECVRRASRTSRQSDYSDLRRVIEAKSSFPRDPTLEEDSHAHSHEHTRGNVLSGERLFLSRHKNNTRSPMRRPLLFSAPPSSWMS